MGHTLILGVGNILLTDDGAGVHAMNLFRKRLPEQSDIECIDGGTLSFNLAAVLSAADNLIVFDAAEIDAKPGTLRVYEGTELDEYLGRRRLSVHEIGIADLLEITRLQGDAPANRALIGIQPRYVEWGSEPCHEVAAALPLAVEKAFALLDAWGIGKEQVLQ